ncbi:hypothetical protein ACS86_10490 [Vibrio alginolyticus]|nr:hypothetical protein ACS86_10490 [Vibrio alginolyticus]
MQLITFSLVTLAFSSIKNTQKRNVIGVVVQQILVQNVASNDRAEKCLGITKPTLTSLVWS